MLRRPLDFSHHRDRYLFVDALGYRAGQSARLGMLKYERVSPWDAAAILRQLVHAPLHDTWSRRLVRELAGALPVDSRARAFSQSPLSAPTPRDVEESLIKGLGRPLLNDPDGVARFATYHLLREPRPAPAPPLDPWKEDREKIDAARRAPRAWVAVEVHSEDERPLSNCRLELLLADGDVRSVYTNLEGRAHLENIPQGQCHIRVPEKDGGAWHPAAGPSSTRVDEGRRRQHVVQQGDHIGSIAHQYGISDEQRIWHASENKQVRTQRANPNVLMPGDQIAVPAIAVHEIVRPTDTTHRLVVKAPATALLRLRLIDEKREPIANGPYEVREKGKTLASGEVSAGKVDCRIPLTTKEVTLVFKVDGVQVEQLVRVGALDPVDEVSGIQARLANLGWYSGEIDGKESAELTSAANAFRAHAGLAKSGDLDESFQKALAREHGV